MTNAGFLLLGPTLAQFSAACGGEGTGGAGGAATAAIDGATFAVGDVRLTFEPGEDGYFRIEGTDANIRTRTVFQASGAALRSTACLASKLAP